jgi:energy-coupling factor transporter ATP-binding protein EcfA2
MITRAKFQNFKALRDVEIMFDSHLTVLVGPNGSGKTSVLQGMNALAQLAVLSGSDPEVELPRLADYISIGAADDLFSVAIEGLRRRFGEYSVSLDRTKPGWISGTLSAQAGEIRKQWRVGSQFHNGRWLDQQRQDQLLPLDTERFDTTAFIRFSAGQLAAPTLIRVYPPQIAKDGSGLAATLSHIKSKYPDQFEAIIDAFRRVIPNVKGVRFDKEMVPGTQFYGDILLVDYQGVEGVKAAHVSSGTLFALGLLTVALGSDSANVILLDDLDHGLHPKAQMELVEVFRSLIQQNPDLQIVATSHSPYILNQLEWNEVLVTSRGDDGSAICKPLTDHPDFERWKDSMSPGEFWGTFYEDWLIRTRTPQTVP